MCVARAIVKKGQLSKKLAGIEISGDDSFNVTSFDKDLAESRREIYVSFFTKKNKINE